jgi:hypothetical protein
MKDFLFKLVCFSLEKVTKVKSWSRHIYTLSLTSGLDWVGGTLHASAVLPLGLIWYPMYTRLAGPQSRSGVYGKYSYSGIRSAERQARSESLYLLSCPFKLIWFTQTLCAVEK